VTIYLKDVVIHDHDDGIEAGMSIVKKGYNVLTSLFPVIPRRETTPCPFYYAMTSNCITS